MYLLKKQIIYYGIERREAGRPKAPRPMFDMRFATKKECSALLAFLGEENWRSANIQKGSCPFVQVSWVDGHIVTVRQVGGHLLLRVGVILVLDQGEIMERLLEAAAMREVEDHCFSSRVVCGLTLAEVSGYVSAGSGRTTLEGEYRKMQAKLDRALGTSSNNSL